MQNGAFVGECGAPEAMKVTVKVIRAGRAAGVSVTTSPADPDVAGCINRYVRTFRLALEPEDGLLHDDVLTSSATPRSAATNWRPSRNMAACRSCCAFVRT